MPFTTSVAGPSRLPFQAATKTCRRSVSRRHASSAAGEPRPPPRKVSSNIFFADWIKSEGSQYRDVPRGQKAKWLGDKVPYASNPTFRPPPPLSDYMQNQVYTELRRGRKVAELAEKFNISKARVEAIRKLKEVEDEFNRRSIPLQTAFQKGMEPLLGVQIPINPSTKEHDAARARHIDQAHDSHPSTSAERLEEQRWDSGVGQEGAFGAKTRENASEGVERTAWEFRDEEQNLEDTRVLAQKEEELKQDPAHHGVVHEVLKREVMTATLFPTPVTEQAALKKEKDASKANELKVKKDQVEGVTVGGIHFVDTSFTNTFGSDNRGAKLREKRHRRKESKKA
ncbi:mitochondrial 37S ribosomal protein mS45 [Kwoniella dejecticola CBS 10117]|uniref:37S ribosomal protein S35, mitochondrial n=1 Tax=Kwoniella dejecticola CBS 10117 TaxID=1296121 RepID=A0A1A6A8V5_9TREE|nr:uncharacterized protein I303_02497 [Kwoniella dejecticola CBS 10117]OBR86490.1 hypothetical protein I303_02497 [Kwoniella dejecticola CBS 10117]